MPSSHRPDRLVVAFDDDHAVANAGLVLPALLAQRLGVQQLADALIDLGERPGAAAHPGSKLLTLVHSLLAGGDCIDDADLLRSGSTAAVLGHRVVAPSTLGTFLRGFTFGHVRQLDRLAEQVLTRAWAAGAGPGAGPLTVDVDSTVCEVYGHAKQGAAYGYTRVLGYHPLLATRADTGEVLHARMRTGRANTARGAERFVEELAGRVRRAGASGQLTLRADSGFWSAKVLAACRRHHIRYSVTVRQTTQVQQAITAIEETAWTPIDYPDGGVAEVAEASLGGDRLVVRRTRLVGAQATLWPDWRYHALVTDREGTPVQLDADHRRHAVMELAIRDLKQGAGLRHCPSGKFLANAAWLVITTLAHNLLRWVAALGSATAGWWPPRPYGAGWSPCPPADPLGPTIPTPPPTAMALGQRLHPGPRPAASPHDIAATVAGRDAQVSWDDAVWVVQPIDIAALLPVPSRWQHYDHQDFTCWQLDGERWLISVCDPEPINPAEVPERVRELLPGGGLPDQHRPGTDQPITGRMGLPQPGHHRTGNRQPRPRLRRLHRRAHPLARGPHSTADNRWIQAKAARK